MNWNELMPKIILGVISALTMGGIGMLFWFAKRYFDELRSQTNLNSQRLIAIYEMLTDVKAAQGTTSNDVARIEGSLDGIRKDVKEHSDTVKEHSMKLQALFKIADAPVRASDAAGK